MAKDILKKKKPKLVDWLSLGHIDILQHVQSREFITDPEYDNLKSISVARKQVVELLDIIYGKGDKVCRDFLTMLKEDDVNEFSPELRDWSKTVNIPDTTDNAAQTPSRAQVTSNISASGGSSLFAPVLAFNTCSSVYNIIATDGKSSAVKSQRNEKDYERGASGPGQIQDCLKFLKDKMSLLVQNVKNIDPIIDDLGLSSESVANIRVEATHQGKMRKLLEYMNSKSIAKRLVDALNKHESDLMNDLLS